MRVSIAMWVVALGLVPVAAQAQSSQQWRDFGAALGNAIANGQQQQQPQQPPQNPKQYRSVAPNSSGQANMGNLNSGNFFPSNNSGFNQPGYQPGNQYPSGSNYRPQSQYQPQYQNQPVYNNQPVYSGTNNAYRPQPTATIGDPPPVPKAAAYSNLPILLECPAGLEGQCHYELINSAGKAYPYDIHAGEKQTFNETTQWQLRYDQGQGKGFKTYQLRGGKQYSLQKDEQGLWALYMDS